MDNLLVELINARRGANSVDTEDASGGSTKAYKVEPSHSDMGGEERARRECIGKKRPNKQQQKQLGRARLADFEYHICYAKGEARGNRALG